MPLCLVFSQCGCHQDALEAFEKAGCWEQVFVAASLLHYTEPQKIEAGRRIARESEREGRGEVEMVENHVREKGREEVKVR